jgi:Outer membrane protein (porin)
MKKTILAVVTSSLFAASANAAVVYDKDGQQVDIYGRMEYDAGQMGFKTSNAQDVNSFGGDASARLGINGKWATASDVSLLGKLEYQLNAEGNDAFSAGKDANTNSIFARYAFVGADFGNGIQATIGQQDSAYAELKDVTDTFNYFDGVNEDQFGNGRWADSAKVAYAADGWDLRASVASSDANKDTAAQTSNYFKDAYSAAAGYTFKLDNVQSLKAVLAYQAATEHLVATDDTTTDAQYALGLGYTYDAFYLGSTYGQRKHDVADYKDDIWTATASYKVLPELTAYTNYEIVDPHNAAGKATETSPSGANGEFYVFGTEYDFTPKAKVYAEYKLNRVSGYDNQYVAGLQYNF